MYKDHKKDSVFVTNLIL